jgi:hypothetical protein
MIRRGFTIDTQKLIIDKPDITYDDTVFDSFYFKQQGVSSKEGANLLFAAQTFPMECKTQIELALKELATAKKFYEDTQARVYYRTFRAIRDGEKVYKE